MGRGRGRQPCAGESPIHSIDDHPLRKMIIPYMQVSGEKLEIIKASMPAPEMMDAPHHGWTHIMHMLIYASELCRYSDFDLDVVKWAIIFHDTGRMVDEGAEENHPRIGAEVMGKVLRLMRVASRGGIGAHSKVIDLLAGRIHPIILNHTSTEKAQTTEEAVLRTADRLDLWRVAGFKGLNAAYMDAPGWKDVEKVAKKLRLEGSA